MAHEIGGNCARALGGIDAPALFLQKNLYFRKKHSFINTTSRNIGRDGCMGRAPPQFFWGTVPSHPTKSPPMSAREYGRFNFYRRRYI